MDTKHEDSEAVSKAAGLCCSQRLVLALQGTVGFAALYLLRINFSMAVVCMTAQPAQVTNNTNASWLTNGTEHPSDQCQVDASDYTLPQSQGEFLWEKQLRGLMLSAFFWGYVITQLPGGALSNWLGGKHVLGTGMLVSTVANMLIPAAARLHPYLVITLRFIMGLGHGVVWPAMHDLFGRWAPPLERSKLMATTYAGGSIGTVIALVTSGYLCDLELDNGWPLIFYIHGIVGVVWWLMWVFLVSNSPAHHPRISHTERLYIQSSIGPSAYTKNFAMPWRSILTSGPVWGILVAHFADNWASYTILTSIPTYMKEVLNFDIKTNGLLCSVPYICVYFCQMSVGQLADCLRSRGLMSTTAVRKTFQAIAFLIPSIFITAVGFVTCENRYLAVLFLTIGLTFTAFGRVAYLINHVDIAPRFSAVLFGLSNTVATIPGMTAPYIAAALTPNGTREEWQIVFYVCGAIFLIGLIAYSALASGVEQDWAKIPAEKEVNVTQVQLNPLVDKKGEVDSDKDI